MATGYVLPRAQCSQNACYCTWTCCMLTRRPTDVLRRRPTAHLWCPTDSYILRMLAENWMHCTHLRCVAHAAIYAEQRAADAEAMTNTRLLKQPATADIIGTDYTTKNW